MAGMIRTAVLCIAAAVFLSCAVAEDPAAPSGSPSVAHIVAHKSVVEKQLVIGQNMTIKIEVFNAGSSVAKAVEVTDPGGAAQLDPGFSQLTLRLHSTLETVI